MSKKHWIPHPLTTEDDKTKKLYLEELAKEWETLQSYIARSSNPRWAASHLVRAIAAGLDTHDHQTSLSLQHLANQLSQGHRKEHP